MLIWLVFFFRLRVHLKRHTVEISCQCDLCGMVRVASCHYLTRSELALILIS